MGILLLTKVIFAIMIGFVGALIAGIIIVPLMRNLHVGQTISEYVGKTHLKKNGVPTLGGLIFIIPTLLATLVLVLTGKMKFTTNLDIILLTFISYAVVGFLYDF